MDKKQIQVVLIETFQGKKYVLRTDREYEEPLMKLLKSLFKKAPLGSQGCCIDEGSQCSFVEE